MSINATVMDNHILNFTLNNFISEYNTDDAKV